MFSKVTPASAAFMTRTPLSGAAAASAAPPLPDSDSPAERHGEDDSAVAPRRSEEGVGPAQICSPNKRGFGALGSHGRVDPLSSEKEPLKRVASEEQTADPTSQRGRLVGNDGASLLPAPLDQPLDHQQPKRSSARLHAQQQQATIAALPGFAQRRKAVSQGPTSSKGAGKEAGGQKGGRPSSSGELACD